MSHFSVCVIVPDDGVVNNIHANNLEDHLIPVLAPSMNRQRKRSIANSKIARKRQKPTLRMTPCVSSGSRMAASTPFTMMLSTSPSSLREDRIYAFGPNRDRKSKLRRRSPKALELVTDYPVKSWYPSFEAYCDEHRGFVKASDGRWGYTCNPNAKWDWWQIGGRFPNRFLVPAGLQDCIPSAKDDDGESATHPRGVSVCRCRTQEGYLLGCHA